MEQAIQALRGIEVMKRIIAKIKQMQTRRQRGSIMVLTAVMIGAMLGILALSIDLGFVWVKIYLSIDTFLQMDYRRFLVRAATQYQIDRYNFLAESTSRLRLDYWDAVELPIVWL